MSKLLFIALALSCVHCGTAAFVSGGDAGESDAYTQADGNAGFRDGRTLTADGGSDTAIPLDVDLGPLTLDAGDLDGNPDAEDGSEAPMSDGGAWPDEGVDLGSDISTGSDAGPCPGRCHYDGSANAYQPGTRESDGTCSISLDSFRCSALDGCDPYAGCVAP